MGEFLFSQTLLTSFQFLAHAFNILTASDYLCTLINAMTQYEFKIGPFSRGFHLITEEVNSHIAPLPELGILHLFIKHTSAGLCINENCDPDVLHDFELYFDKLAPENIPWLRHTMEGPDDMPAHIKSVLSGSSVSIPISNHRFNLGTWQGIYLCEFRNRATARTLVATLIG
jgi:secondary thiamine-phosphate synthase enzyme